jgi:hypothetical protein
MREIATNLGTAKFAHNLAKTGRPPPLAVAAMLGLTRRLGQATADHGSYHFSLGHPNSLIFSGL